MRFAKIPSILSTVPDLSCMVIFKQHRENREEYSLSNLPYLGWIFTLRCVCDVTIATRIGPTAANKLRWRNFPDKIQYQSHYNLLNSALVLLKVTANYLFWKYRLWALIFKIPARQVKYRPSGNPTYISCSTDKKVLTICQH